MSSIKQEHPLSPTSPSPTQFAPSSINLSQFLSVDLNTIGNKAKRAELRARLKNEKSKQHKKHKKQKTDNPDALPSVPQRTIESMRQYNDTHKHDINSIEYMNDINNDEFAAYFNNTLQPKIILTSNQKYLRQKSETYQLILSLLHCLPHSYFYQRKNYTIQQIVQQAITYSEQLGEQAEQSNDNNNDDESTDDVIAPEGNEHGEHNDTKSNTNDTQSMADAPFTDILILNENEYKCNGLTHIHLPSGPTIFYSLRSLKLPAQLGKTALPTDYKPEIILNNFSSKLGLRVSRMISVLFPSQPEFQGRRVITFHNQRDYIFFRQHRYIFGNNQHGKTRAKLQEIGPRFTLKLKWLQSGTFDTKHGAYEFIMKNDSDQTKRTFHL